MNWLIWASVAVLLVVVIAVLAASRREGERKTTAAPADPQSPATSGTSATPDRASAAQSRVHQFLHTGSHRVIEPPSDVSNLKAQRKAMLEQAVTESDLATLDAFLADVRDSLGADEAVFWRWSEERDALAPSAWSTEGVPRPANFDMGAWGPLVKWAAEGRIMHFDADARVAVTRLAAAPIQHEDRLIGVLSVARAEGLDRGREHLKTWLPRHAAQVGRLVLLFEMRRDYGRHVLQNTVLLAASTSVQGHKSQESLCKAICDTALQVSSATEAAVIRWRPDVGRGWVQHATPGFKHKAPFPLSENSLAAEALAGGMPMLIEDVAKVAPPTSIFFENDGGWPKGTVAVMPLTLDTRVIGGILVASELAGDLPQEETRNIGLLGALAAASLEVVWEMEEVSRRARTDALTGLANRRAFDDSLEQLFAHSDRFGHSLSLIVADVDHFKAVNDKWGHETGDAVLKSIARTLVEGVRAVDVCARFGGEELAILLPQTTLVGAVELADRLRKAVETKPITVEGEPIAVTISCGVACYPEGVLTKEALFAAADRAMYDAKSSGRNCVKSAVPKPIGVVR